MAKKKVNVEIGEGQVFKMQGNDGFTELEQRAMSGKLDVNELTSDIPADVKARASELMAKADDELVAKFSSITPKIAQPQSIGDLDPAQRDAVLGRLAQMDMSKLAVLNTPKVEESVPAELPAEYQIPKKEPAPAHKHVTQEEKKLCPNCAWDLDHTPDKLDKTDKANWMRAILGHKPFEKTYKLFDGKMEVSFRTRSMEEQDLIHQQLTADSTSGVIPAQPLNLHLVVHNGRRSRFNLTASLVHVTGMSGRLPSLTSEEAKTIYGSKVDASTNIVGAAHSLVFGGWSEALFAIVYKQFSIFDDLCFRLAEASASPNFWMETGV